MFENLIERAKSCCMCNHNKQQTLQANFRDRCSFTTKTKKLFKYKSMKDRPYIFRHLTSHFQNTKFYGISFKYLYFDGIC